MNLIYLMAMEMIRPKVYKTLKGECPLQEKSKGIVGVVYKLWLSSMSGPVGGKSKGEKLK